MNPCFIKTQHFFAKETNKFYKRKNNEDIGKW